jgi:peptidoglycan/LPS O-acetylase OafA/YrhL
MLLPLVKKGYQAVSFFYVLSGFVMSYVYYAIANASGLNVSSYWKARFARVYPAYLGALLFVAGVYTFYWNKPASVTDLGLGIFCLHSWVPNEALTLNYPGWSISVEAFFYALFPALILLFKNKSSKTLVLVTLILWLATQLVFIGLNQYLEFTKYFPPLHLSSFFMGVAAGIMFARNDEVFTPILRWSTAIAIGVPVLMLAYLYINPSWSKYDHNGLLAPLHLLFILALAVNTSAIGRVLSNSVLEFLGEVSYGMYIYQYPAYIATKIVYDFGHWDKTQPTFVAMLFAILLVMSTISFYGIETPFRKLLRK